MRCGVVVLGVVLLGACSKPEKQETKPRVVDVSLVDSKLVPNLRRVSATIYSSGKPENEEAFKEIAALGIKTIISVDGEKPNVEAARRAGLRYVHLPFMYSGIPQNRALEIAKAARDLPGPVLIHCHHGKHRSPAAAAIARLAMEGTTEEALAEMKAAGTDPHYKGLYRSVAEFKRPSSVDLDAVACSFPEIAPLEPLIDAMVENDYRLDRIAAGQPQEGDFAHEALLLREGLSELRRFSAGREAAFNEMLDSSLEAARALEEEAKKGVPSKPAISRVKRSCAQCHDHYRDQ